MKVKAKYKICRKLGDAVFAKCENPKYAINEQKKKGTGRRRSGRRRSVITPYGLQLREKQKIRYTYNLSEKQLSNYVKKARNDVAKKPAEALYRLLETRLDNIVYRLGLANSRQFSRQIVSHGHIMVNGKRVNIPSYEVKVGDTISIPSRSKDKAIFINLAEKVVNTNIPSWLRWAKGAGSAELADLPVMGEYESNLKFGSIIEFYSRV